MDCLRDELTQLGAECYCAGEQLKLRAEADQVEREGGEDGFGDFLAEERGELELHLHALE
jgi:hypothetical protein